MTTSGLYVIEHRSSGRRYYGSSIDVPFRLHEHRRLLRRGAHHSPYLQRAWNKHGESAFDFKPVAMLDAENLLEFEQRAIDSNSGGYNMNPIAGKPPSPKGKKRSKAHCKALSRALLGNQISESVKAKLRRKNTLKKPCPYCGRERKRYYNKHGKMYKLAHTCGDWDCHIAGALKGQANSVVARKKNSRGGTATLIHVEEGAAI